MPSGALTFSGNATFARHRKAVAAPLHHQPCRQWQRSRAITVGAVERRAAYLAVEQPKGVQFLADRVIRVVALQTRDGPVEIACHR